MLRVSLRATWGLLRANAQPVRLRASKEGIRINETFDDRRRALAWTRYHVLQGFRISAAGAGDAWYTQRSTSSARY